MYTYTKNLKKSSSFGECENTSLLRKDCRAEDNRDPIGAEWAGGSQSSEMATLLGEPTHIVFPCKFERLQREESVRTGRRAGDNAGLFIGVLLGLSVLILKKTWRQSSRLGPRAA